MTPSGSNSFNNNWEFVGDPNRIPSNNNNDLFQEEDPFGNPDHFEGEVQQQRPSNIFENAQVIHSVVEASDQEQPPFFAPPPPPSLPQQSQRESQPLERVRAWKWKPEETEFLKKRLMEIYRKKSFKEVMEVGSNIPIEICRLISIPGRTPQSIEKQYRNLCRSKPVQEVKRQQPNYFWDQTSIDKLVDLVAHHTQYTRTEILSGRVQLGLPICREIGASMGRSGAAIFKFFFRMGTQLAKQEEEDEAMLPLLGKGSWKQIRETMAKTFPVRESASYRRRFLQLKQEKLLIRNEDGVYSFVKASGIVELKLDQEQVAAFDKLWAQDDDDEGDVV